MADEKADSVVEPVETPLFKVITPDATPEEIAAVVAVFAAMGGPAAAPDKPRSEWASPARRMRTMHTFGRGAWQASARAGR
jgi:Acyl-CoA carboxylase epsilon subunit